MRIITSVLVLAGMLVSTAALAEGFDGVFVQASAGMNMGSVKVSNNERLNGNYSALAPIGEIGVGTSKSFGRFNLAVGGYYVFGEQKLGQKTVKGEGVTETAQVTQQDMMGITIEPGMLLGERALVYGKLGYAKANVRESVSIRHYASEHDTEDFDGPVIGAGIKYRLPGDRFYAVAEVKHQTLKTAHDIKPSSLSITGGLGAIF